jgi:hypothetical protein
MAIDNFSDLVTQVNNMLSNFATTVGDDIISENRSSTTLFDKGSGYYVNSPIAPITSAPIALDVTGAVKGGFCVIWYKGAVLSYTDFTGGDVVMFNGVNVLNQLCRIVIDYDKVNAAFSIGIQTGHTGIVPTSTLPAPMTSFVGVQSELPSTLPLAMTSFIGVQSDL